MASGLLIFPGAQPSRSRSGGVIPAELRFYLNETTTPAVVYTDEALTIPHTFPIVSDDAGRFALIWADTADVFSCNWSTQAPDSQSVSFDDLSTTNGADVELLDSMNAVLSDAMDLYESLDAVNLAVDQAQIYAGQAAASATGAPGTNSTSSTSLTIGSGNKSLTVGVSKLYVAGMTVAIASTASPNNSMSGIVQSYDNVTGALVVTINTISGSGTFAAWTISLSAITAPAQVIRSTRTANTILAETDRRGYVDVTSGTFTQTVTPSSVLGAGWWCYYGNSGTGVVTIDPDSAETINGLSTLTLNPGEVILLQADGSNLNAIFLKRDLGPHVIAQDQKAAGTAGGSASASAWTTRTLNTLSVNLVGASLATNAVTLPAGTWCLQARAPFSATGGTQIRIRNTTDSTTAVAGGSHLFDSISVQAGDITAVGRVTIASTKAFTVEYYALSAGTLGSAPASGEVATYTELRATKLY